MASLGEQTAAQEHSDEKCAVEDDATNMSQERKLTRAEQLELWKKSRQKGGAATASSSHTSAHHKQRSLQGLTLSQVNQRTGGIGSSGSKPWPTGALASASAPGPLCVRLESDRLSIGGSRSSTGSFVGRQSPAGSFEEGSTGPSRQATPCHQSASRDRTGSSSDDVPSSPTPRGVDPDSTSAMPGLLVDSSPAIEERRFSVHVAADDDDDEVEWRVPVSKDSVLESQELSPGPAQDETNDTNRDTTSTSKPANPENDDAADPFPPGAALERRISDCAGARSDVASIKDTEVNGVSEFRDDVRPLEHQGIQSTRAGILLLDGVGNGDTGVMISASHIQRDTSAFDVEAAAGSAWSAVVSGQSNPQGTSENGDDDDGHMELIAEAWNEDHDEDREMFGELRSKLFDTTSRLAQCTSILQRLVEENTELKQEVASMKEYKSKCAALEASLGELRELYHMVVPDAPSPLALAPASEEGERTSKRPAQDVCDDESLALEMGAGMGKRARLSPQRDGTETKREHDDDGEGGSGAEEEDVPVEIRLRVLRSRASEREQEVVRLRRLVQSREDEFSQERKQLVAKLIASEQARREGEAALEANDAMWQQLVQNQMAAIQQKIAAQQQPTAAPCTNADEQVGIVTAGKMKDTCDADGHTDSETQAQASAGCGAGEVAAELRQDRIGEEVNASGGDEKGLESPDAQKVQATKRQERNRRRSVLLESTQILQPLAPEDSSTRAQGESDAGIGGDIDAARLAEEDRSDVASNTETLPLSPASSLVAAWAARRRTMGGDSSQD